MVVGQEQWAELQNSLRRILEEARLASERVIVMIDRSNLDQTWRRVEANPANRPDYLKLMDLVIGGRTCRQVRIYFSDIDPDLVQEADRAAWQSRQDFYTFLRHQGWILRGVRKKVYDGVSVEKGLDGALIRDMETVCRDGRCDTVVLIAGDADYCDVVSDVRDRYCMKVEVAFFPNQTARELQVAASRFVNLDCLRDRFTRKLNG